MNSMLYYTADFFDTLILDADRAGHTYKVMLSESVKAFLEDPSKDNAYIVYSMFFDVYRLGHKDNRSFVDLLDILRSYEESTGSFNDAQRVPFEREISAALKRIGMKLPSVGFLSDHYARTITGDRNRDYSYMVSEKLYREALINQGFDVVDEIKS